MWFVFERRKIIRGICWFEWLYEIDINIFLFECCYKIVCYNMIILDVEEFILLCYIFLVIRCVREWKIYIKN